jgi:hypothetical protein
VEQFLVPPWAAEQCSASLQKDVADKPVHQLHEGFAAHVEQEVYDRQTLIGDEQFVVDIPSLYWQSKVLNVHEPSAAVVEAHHIQPGVAGTVVVETHEEQDSSLDGQTIEGAWQEVTPVVANCGHFPLVATQLPAVEEVGHQIQEASLRQLEQVVRVGQFNAAQSVNVVPLQVDPVA